MNLNKKQNNSLFHGNSSGKGIILVSIFVFPLLSVGKQNEIIS